MNNKKKLPVLVSDFKLIELNRVANRFVKNFSAKIFPLMLKYGVLDEPHIKKYLQCDTMEVIYKDAMRENPETIKRMEQMSFFCDIDAWADIRDCNSPVKSPNEKGFIFAPMPLKDYNYRKSIMRAISVKDGGLFVDEKILEDECIIKPTEKQEKLYEIAAEFCETLKEMGFHKRSVNSIIINTRSGIKPYISGIMDSNAFSEKK